ncbi:Acetylcholine receptor subunit alpha-like 1 [Halotydeus destructor]|nr:Acetylcholine receptor subunit alpha-like 1 [Halotydeus destructor]
MSSDALVIGNPDAKRLYEDLMSSYNLKSQVMTTNVWVEQEWYDHTLRWEPSEYGSVAKMHVPAEEIWLPDIVLYNNADGNYEVPVMTKANLHHDGLVVWKPPAIYKSSCMIDVEYFPFDQQTCLMKFGSWTYDGHEVDLRHAQQTEGSVEVPIGIDMSEFYKSVEWDILLVPAKYNEEFYDCCPEPYPDITFNLTMRRKTLFYTVNLIIPCVGISFLTVLVFYLPSECGEKVTLSISILVSLTVFFLLLAEIIPPTSLAVPLLGKYLLFTMILVTLSICITVGVLNVYFRSPSTHKMAPWVRTLFIHMMPRLLLMKRPSLNDLEEELSKASMPNTDKATSLSSPTEVCPSRNNRNGYRGLGNNMDDDIPGLPVSVVGDSVDSEQGLSGFLSSPAAMTHGSLGRGINWTNNDKSVQPLLASYQYSSEVQKAIESILFIADHIKKEDDDNKVIEDWKYVAMVLDRLFLWIFTIACLVGTCGIMFKAPSLYDTRPGIDSKLSQIGK